MMKDWLDTDKREPFFGLDRDPMVKLDDVEVRPSSYVSDVRTRGWRERLFTFPFRPLTKYVPSHTAFLVGKNQVLVSWQTFRKIRDAVSGRET